MMKSILFVFTVFVSSLCIAQDSTNQKFEVDKDKIVVLKSQEFEEFKNFTTLADSELINIEQILQNCVNEYNSNLDSTSYQLLRLENYFRQYVPYFKDGNKIVWANFFCKGKSTSFPYWKNELVIVFDGGGCFFQLTVNLTKHECSKINVNSVALRKESKIEL